MKICKILKKLEEDESDLTQSELELLLDIIKQQLKFMFKYNILITPKNFERWFLVFCHIVENNKQLSDKEIFNLYGEFYEHCIKKENTQSKEINDNLERIADQIEIKLFEIINLAYLHQENILKHQRLTESLEDEKFSIILEELKRIRENSEKLTEKLEKYHREIKRLNTELKSVKYEAKYDFLTGLVNRRSFERALEDLLKAKKEKDYNFTLILMDIDDFKKINDTYGHLAGDTVLRGLSIILKTFLRANTIIGRLGGEEFGIILPGLDCENGIKVADRIRSIIENREVIYKDKVIRITASFGLTESRPDDTKESIYNRADKALYIAKKEGKNKVICL